MAIIFAAICFLHGNQAAASPNSLNFQGRILKTDGTPLEYENVSFIFQVTDPAGACVVYQEQINGFNMKNSGGVFDIPIGLGSVTHPTTGSFTILDAFNNTSTFDCKGGSSTYVASSGDLRKLRVQFYDGIGWRMITPDSVIRTVPYAAYAASAQKLGTFTSSDFILKAGVPSCSANSFLTFNGTNLVCTSVSGATGGTVTSVGAGTGLLGGPITSSGTLSVNVGTGANQIVQMDASAKLPAVDGSQLTNLDASQVTSGTLPSANLPVVPIAKGGTGATTRAAGINALLPSQSSEAGKILQTDGTNVSWINTPITGITALTGDVTAAGTGSVAATIADDAVTTSKIADSSVNSAKILNGSIGVIDLSFAVTMPVNSGVVVRNGSQFFNKSCAVDGEALVWNAATGWDCANLSTVESDPKIGTNTTNYLSKWDGSKLVTSGVFENAGRVGIGTAVPSTGLHIVGTSGNTLRIVDGNEAAGRVLMSNASGVATWTAVSSTGAVTGVTATAPVVSSGGTAPVISMPAADGSTNGHLTSADWTVFNAKAPTASPVFTGTPTAPTAIAGTNTTQLATTAFVNSSVLGQASNATPLMDGVAAAGAATTFSRGDHVHPTDTSRAPAAGSTNITTLGTITTGVWNGSIIPVTYGGTGTATGSITGTGALNFTAGGANQNVTLTPSGTGYTILNGNVGIGTSTPTASLHVNGSLRIVDGSEAAGRVLTSDGSGNTSWVAPTVGTVTNVTATAPLASTGGATPVISLNTVPIASGGTGATTATAAINALLPSQGSNAGKILQTDGTNTSWVNTPITGITALTGDVTASGTGSAVATIAANAVTSAKILDNTIQVNDLKTLGVMAVNSGLLVHNGTDFHNMTCSGNQVLIWTVSNGWECSNAVLSELDPKVGSNTTNYLSKWSGSQLVTSGVFESAGNVGIGTATPGSKLDVSGMIRATHICDSTGANCKDLSVSWTSGSVTNITAGTGLNVGAGPGGSITSTGTLNINVGTGANQILQLNGSSQIPAVSGVNLTALNASNLGSGTVPAARLPAFTGDVTSTAGSSALTLAASVVSASNIDTTTVGIWTPSGANVYRSTGNVGIGTTAPAAKLTVAATTSSGVDGSYAIHAADVATPAKRLVLGFDAALDAGVISATHSGTAWKNVLFPNANVGIGTNSPSEKLEVNGTVKATSFISTSDRRLKKNIETVNGLNTILKLRGVKFNWRSDNGIEYGTIAQEVEKVLPDLVITDKVSGMKGVKYIGLIAPLIEATKDLNNKCDMSAEQIAYLSRAVQAVQADVAKLKRDLASVVDENALLKEQLKALGSRLEKLENKEK